MVEAAVTATEMKNNFGKYLKIIMSGNEVVITRNSQEIGRLIPKERVVSSLTDSLTGVLYQEQNMDEIRENELRRKYGLMD